MVILWSHPLILHLLNICIFKTDPRSWVTETGRCVDATGKRPGDERLARKFGFRENTEDGCFKLCFEDPYLTGCTFLLTSKSCYTYTGDVKGGNGNNDYKCYHRKGVEFD